MSSPREVSAIRPIVITVNDPSGHPFERHKEPVCIGLAFPRGAAASQDAWALTDENGRRIPVQTTVLDRWSDGTTRWALVEFQATARGTDGGIYTFAPNDLPDSIQPSLSVSHDDRKVTVSTGAATFHLANDGPGFLQSVDVGGQSILQSSSIVAEDTDRTRYEFSVVKTSVLHIGLLRSTMCLEGRFVDPRGEIWLHGALQLNFYAGHGAVDAEFCVTNPRAARHPGGTWDLGDAGSVLIRELTIDAVPRVNGTAPGVWGSIDEDDPMAAAGVRFSVYQDSSGGVNWQHINHINRDGRVPATFRGFRGERIGSVVEGLRATPIVRIGSGPEQITAAMPRFWQTCPKAISAQRDRLLLSMFPKEYGGGHELQGGERTTFRFSLCFGPDTISEMPLAWARSRLTVSADPESYREAGAWSALTAGSVPAREAYSVLVQSAVAGDSTFERRRELIDEYGWRNFGDLFADHEAVKQPLASHYNNQYDALAGFMTRHLQTGDSRWRVLADDLALHVADIDLYHTDRDRAAYSGGHFWHTQHYLPAATATHRAYSSRVGSSGGGPSAEHNYTTGLMLHHFLSGAQRSRAAVIQLADWVIRMDDGSKSMFRWIDRGDTGLASGTRSPDFHGPGRGAGNSINALLDAHRLTRERRYLDKADALILRCIDPGDDPSAIGLLDIENRWSYTVFLQVLGKYLEHRAECGFVDEHYAYARAALLAYATWMAANERPYLDRRDELEFPTETWAAQDLRKAAVFEWAARYATDELSKTIFLDRAAQFFDYGTAYLISSPTGRLTRPVVLLLAYGFQRPVGMAPIADAAEVIPRVSSRRSFVPQRRRAIRRLAIVTALGSAAALAGILLYAF